jgi:uncharacterized protein (DUF433 family)
MANTIYNDKIKQIYGGDPRELPIYGLTEASRYLKIHINTLRSWVYGRNYKLEDGTTKFWSPVISLPDVKTPLLSFYNLTEVHVLCGIRRIYNIQFRKVRDALQYLETQSISRHPLATEDFWTDEFELFIKSNLGTYVCASRHGQQVIKEVVEKYLTRIERDIDLSPYKLYPFSKEVRVKNNTRELEALPKNIVIDPLISFGRPTIVGTGVPTNVIAGRFQAGEKVKELAKDYEIEESQIQEALQYEGVRRAA